MKDLVSPAHRTQFNDSWESAIAVERTTVSAASGRVKPPAGVCPRANCGRSNAKPTRAELRIHQPGWIFKSLVFPAVRRKSSEVRRSAQAARRVLAANLLPTCCPVAPKNSGPQGWFGNHAQASLRATSNAREGASEECDPCPFAKSFFLRRCSAMPTRLSSQPAAAMADSTRSSSMMRRSRR